MHLVQFASVLELCPTRIPRYLMMMKVRYIKVLRETYNIRTRYLRYRGGFDLEESAEGTVLANDSM